jgi:hypothetical protein
MPACAASNLPAAKCCQPEHQVPARSTRVASAAAILALTALLSALVNLDVAVVVAMTSEDAAAYTLKRNSTTSPSCIT